MPNIRLYLSKLKDILDDEYDDIDEYDDSDEYEYDDDDEYILDADGFVKLIEFIFSSIIKILLLFLILFFTFEHETLVLSLFAIFLTPVYFILYGISVLFLSQYPQELVIRKNFFTEYILNILIYAAGVALCFGIYYLSVYIGDRL